MSLTIVCFKQCLLTCVAATLILSLSCVQARPAARLARSANSTKSIDCIYTHKTAVLFNNGDLSGKIKKVLTVNSRANRVYLRNASTHSIGLENLFSKDRPIDYPQGQFYVFKSFTNRYLSINENRKLTIGNNTTATIFFTIPLAIKGFLLCAIVNDGCWIVSPMDSKSSIFLAGTDVENGGFYKSNLKTITDVENRQGYTAIFEELHNTNNRLSPELKQLCCE